MKKNLFYAAFAIAMMASCTNEDNLVVDPVEPTPEDKVAITLGIDAPAVNATVGARGTGSVGDVAGANNKWNSQQLYITMIDRATGAVAKNNGANIMAWDQYTYMAPRADDQTTGQEGKGTIRIYPEDATLTDDQGELQYQYYPVQGEFDFYGWHLDDATATTDITANAETAEGAGDGYPTIKLTNITINGTQDIMGAKTKAANSTTYTNWNTELEGWTFSARTARNEIDPILAFEHKLARVKFFVKAGSESAALYDNNGNKKVPKGKLSDASTTNDDPTSTGAMYITAIKAQSMHSKFDMTLDNTGIATSNPTDPIAFVLGDILAEDGVDGTANAGKKAGEIGSLIPVAPNYTKDCSSAPTGIDEHAQVGHAMMFLPVENLTAKSLTFNLDLKQYVQLVEDETDNTPETGPNDKWGYEERNDISVTVNATHVKREDESYATEFKAGESYNVYITIYGFERIEVSAELTPWVDGGDVDVDIEEGTSNAGTGNSGTQTPTTYDITFNVTDGNNAIADPVITVSSPAEATVSGTTITVPAGTQSITYSVTAQGYNPITDVTATVDATTNNSVNVTMSAQAPTTEKVTVTINATPADATVTINGQTVSILEVEKGTDVTWSVTKEGYTAQQGSYTAISEDKTETITLVGEDRTVTFTVSGYKENTTPTITVGEVTLEGTTTTAKVGDVISWKVTGTKDDESIVEKEGTYTVLAEENSNTINVDLAN